MDISIIFVSFNTCQLTDLAIKKLKVELEIIKDKYSSFSSEIILVDNGSTDGTKELIEKEHKDIILKFTGKNNGFAKGNNIGFQIAKGRYIVLLNTDAFFIEGSLLKAYELMDSYRDVSIGVGRLIGKDGSDQPSRRAFPGILSDFFKYSNLEGRYPKNRLFSMGEYGYMNVEEEGPCHWGPGAFNIIREEDLYKVGYFDEDYFMYYEEVDLALRFYRRGYLVYYFPQVKVMHLGGESAKSIKDNYISKSGNQLTLWSFQSKYIYYRKNYGYLKALISYKSEYFFRWLQYKKNKDNDKGKDLEIYLMQMKKAFENTSGGKISPQKPWK